MNIEIIIVAIGCYLFCGVSEKVHYWKTEDYKGGSITYDFEEVLSKFTFVVNETTYERIIDKFGENFAVQRTHAVIRKQKYDEKVYYFNKEVRYVYRKIYNTRNRVAYVSCSSDLELNLYFKDNMLVLFNVYDMRRNANNCAEYVRSFNTIEDESWLAGGENDPSSLYNCNKKFYRIFTLDKKNEWRNARDCDFVKDFKNYWSDPVYSDRQYVTKDTGWPCGGLLNSC